MINWACRIVNLALVLALCVVLLGGWTRINNAGLSCPDWPGCYGRMIVPQLEQERVKAQSVFPETPLEPKKVWLEMGHRYLAGTLGVLIALLGFIAFKMRKTVGYPVRGSYLLLLLVVFQAVFGMWTVTLKLLPQVVTIHLLGGVLTLTGLVLIRQRIIQIVEKNVLVKGAASKWILGAILVLFIQIVLGGWTSSNYAGYGCNDWLVCNDTMNLQPDFKEGFDVFAPIGPNYQSGVLSIEGRAAIQIVHRVGAAVVLVYCMGLIAYLAVTTMLRVPLVVLALTLICQVAIGGLAAELSIPASLAILHHFCAILLLFGLLWLYSNVLVLNEGDENE
ncbi:MULTISPECIES: COX15/CtaA family protein [unclassified Neptuniibacter]|uniref:COX15/CtaA family protein n=1 Tax=unclassified Neptuniibacter TaxID=2630693 RepID=UPI0025F3CD39|nr:MULTISPECIES: COX15/CtaA family protein [unclassified Neptuniibacter]